MTFNFSIPSPTGPIDFGLKSGGSLIFVGANGGGKTRLAVQIETSLGLSAHRISAHRALALNPAVAKISEKQALQGLRTGFADLSAQVEHRQGHRWRNQAETALLNDFDFLVQALFAEQANKSLETHNKARAGTLQDAEFTKFERLNSIWSRLLPHRVLHITGDDIEVSLPASDKKYLASEMSDGERAIFYMIGQTLLAANKSVLIIDEPELHVHRSIMSKLWDELEAARQDCGFVFITHDLDFAAARVAQKFTIRDYDPSPLWTIDAVPEDTGFDEETATLILGSRRPILFVEGQKTSLDLAIYRCCFPDWTVICRGSCMEVIHSVVTMRNNKELTRVTCAGIIDADDHSAQDIGYFRQLGIAVLPVSEIENLFLLPAVSGSIAETDGYSPQEIDERLERLKSKIFATINADAIESVVARYVRRRIDRMLKRLDLGNENTVAGLTKRYADATAEIDVGALSAAATSSIEKAVQNKDLLGLLKLYDNKGLLALAAAELKNNKRADFEAWLTRILRNNKAPGVVNAVRAVLPPVTSA